MSRTRQFATKTHTKNNMLQWLCFVALFNRGALTHARNKYSVTWQHYLVRNSRICVSTLINMDTISIFRITYSLVDVHRTIHMDSYVGVQNDVSLAVRKVLEVKKAFMIQSKCHEALSKKNKSSQLCKLVFLRHIFNKRQATATL